MLAALAPTQLPTYDWSWVWPNVDWMQRMGYCKTPIAPALKTLRALCDYYAILITNIPDGLSREVQLLDSPSAQLYSKTVEISWMRSVRTSKSTCAKSLKFVLTTIDKSTYDSRGPVYPCSRRAGWPI